jgi:RNA polymerase sigma factor (sigma-70 family)
LVDNPATSREGLRKGDEQAAAEVYRRYADRLLKLARSRLSARLSRRIDAEDVVQSAYRSFFLGMQTGEYCVAESDDLWPLLAAIVLNKLRRQAKRHRAARRAIDRETEIRDDDHGVVAERQPSVVDLVVAAEEIAWLLQQLEPKQRAMVERRLRGETIDEIAETMAVSERTVRRWLKVAAEMMADRERQMGTRAAAAVAAPLITTETLTQKGLQVVSPKAYVLKKLLAVGGSGKVYAAQERLNGKPVCVKVLRKHLRGNEKLTASFMNEVALTAKLSHAHIVPLLGIGILADGGLFLVMKQIDGVNLTERMHRGSVLRSELSRVILQIAAALAHSHSQNILHGDLKPENVIVDQDGNAWLTDFGFARYVGEEFCSSSRRGISGTLKYLPPEVIEGNATNWGTWTDVYGLGIILHELLKHAPPDNLLASEWSAIHKLVAMCMRDEPLQRPSLATVIAEVSQILQ